MQNNYFIIALTAVIILATALIIGFFPHKDTEVASAASYPWIEVSEPTVHEVNPETGEIIRELQTGDEFEKEAHLVIAAGAFANIYLPGGSVIRLSEETSFVLTEGSYNAETGDSVVRIKLISGRLWSKVFELTTPDSLWEVETSNTVATVRGTAFGVEYIDGATRIIGSENEVSVKVIDPETQEIIPDAEVIITPNRFIMVDNAMVGTMKKDTAMFTEAWEVMPEAMAQEPWVKRSQHADTVFDIRVEVLEDEGIHGEQMHRAVEVMHREILEEDEALQTEKIIEREEETTTPEEDIIKREEAVSTPVKTEVEEIKTISDKPIIGNVEEVVKREIEDGTTAGTFITPTTLPQPEKIILEVQENITQLEEEMLVHFKAVLLMDNGEKRDMTKEVEWRLLGPIGTIIEPGVLELHLDPSIAELGEATGTVFAAWKDEQTGIILLEKSDLLEVHAKVTKLDERG